ncbi:MAG: hypothetical protein IT178_18095 [Acidobacteria bacterium]|nr:hypothetical protein [Acidobacteriota bacterium]
MTRRFILTLALLAGLAAAPAAQSFSWQAGSNGDAVDRYSDQLARVAERSARVAERVAERLAHSLERAAERAAWTAERQAERVRRQAMLRADRVERRARVAASRAERRVSREVRRGEQDRFDGDPCAEADRWNGSQRQHCDVREQRLPAGALTVDARQNGGIRVEGWDNADILVRAVVHARGRDEAEARQLAGQVQVTMANGRVEASGPDGNRDRNWSVSYRINVPRQTDLALHGTNGGIRITGVAGAITFDTVNGGVQLADLGGRVSGRTQNGGVTVALQGDSWVGDGLDVQTSNGGVTLRIPAGYNAQLETRTVNGGFRSEYPLTLKGELTPRRGISTTLGSGGATVRVQTTNGGVRVETR